MRMYVNRTQPAVTAHAQGQEEKLKIEAQTLA